MNRRQLLASGAAIGAITVLARTPSGRAQATQWEQLATSGDGPVARWDTHIGADQESGLLLVYGGRNGDGTALDDTWSFDLASGVWNPLAVDGPSARFGSATSLDSEKRRFYLFGGQEGSNFFNDTWRFDFRSMSWRLQDDGAAVAPSPRYGLGGSLNGDGNFVISHGFTFAGRFDDTWIFDTRQKVWVDISPAPESRPLKRCLHELVTDPSTGQILLFGGCSSGFGPCPQGDLWSFDPIASSWTNITPGAGPSARSNPAMVWDTAGGRALLFGGLSDAGPMSDLWEGRFVDSGFEWAELPVEGPMPDGRSSHDAVLLDNALYMFGGKTANGPAADIWRLKL